MSVCVSVMVVVVAGLVVGQECRKAQHHSLINHGDGETVAAAAVFRNPPTGLRSIGLDGGWRMWIAGAGRGRQCVGVVEWTRRRVRGVRWARNGKPPDG